MTAESEITVLISNILDEKHYAHCRLCLRSIVDDAFAKFEDCVDYTGSEDFTRIADILGKIFGWQIIEEETIGLDAVCSECLNKATEVLKFIENCEITNRRLNNILDSLNTTLNADIDTTNKKLYIVWKDNSTELILVENEKTKKIMKCKCTLCKDIFATAEEVKKHTYNKHGLFTCIKCHYAGTSQAEIEEHEESTKLLKCSTCQVQRCTESSIKDHEDNIHGSHVCKECGKSYKGLDKLLAHEDKHSSKSECPKCGKQYTTKEFYQKHVKLCLAGEVKNHPLRSEIKKTYFCSECGKGYSTAGGLRVHEKFVHGDAEPHVCKQCGKKFTAPSYLKAHLITHTGAKNFKCDICKNKFVTKEALLYHTRRHTGEKPYSCNLCGEKFVNSSSRADHIKHKHIGPTINCELCSRKFVTKNFLRLHMKKHYDPTNKLYIRRNNVPPNIPAQENMRCWRVERENDYD